MEYNRLYLDDFPHLRSYNLLQVGYHGFGLWWVVTLVARLLLWVVTVVARLLLRVVVMVTLSGCHGSAVSRLHGSRVILVDSRVVLVGSRMILVGSHVIVLLDGCTSGKRN